jgi:hypothetical protein
VVTRIKRWDKGNFREGYVPNPEHRGGPWGVAWTNFPQRASLPPGIVGGNLEKGGRGKRGGTRIERLPRVLSAAFNAGKHKAFLRVKMATPEH